MTKLLSLIKEEKLTIVGLIIGILAGFLYWRFVGCNSGSCSITSSPFLSSLWGGMTGGLLFGAFKKDKKKYDDKRTI